MDKKKQVKSLEKWRQEYSRQKREHPGLPGYYVSMITSDHIALERKKVKPKGKSRRFL